MLLIQNFLASENAIPRKSKEMNTLTKSISVPQFCWSQILEIVTNFIDLDLQYDVQSDSTIVKGKESFINRLGEFLSGWCPQEPPVKSSYEEEKQSMAIDSNIEHNISSTEFCLNSVLKDRKSHIESKAQSWNLAYEIFEEKIRVHGLESNVFAFLQWLYGFTIELFDLEFTKIQQRDIYFDRSSSTLEISISTFHRMFKQDILNKCTELNILCDFGYEIIRVSGELNSLNELKIFLQDLEAFQKRSLYPKYWDFYNTNIFSEHLLPHDSEEFQEVESIFRKSMPDAQITKLTRLQNKYLMDSYINTLQKRQEIRRDDQINRRLLFHGTRNTPPSELYMNSDTGFDLQYAKTSGMYGPGLYFAEEASYSHKGYKHEVRPNTYQLLLADVFTGTSYNSSPNNKIVKAPHGYDSVNGSNGIHVIYNNFHSYPLYLIEYTVQTIFTCLTTLNAPPSQAGQIVIRNDFHLTLQNNNTQGIFGNLNNSHNFSVIGGGFGSWLGGSNSF